MSIPENLKYTKDHEWVKVEGSEAVVGITEFAQSELGEIVFVELPEVGTNCEQHGTLCVVESTKAASDVYSPLSGSVTQINDNLQGSPELINTDPYGAGWMVRLAGVSESDLENLLDAKAYAELVGE